MRYPLLMLVLVMLMRVTKAEDIESEIPFRDFLAVALYLGNDEQNDIVLRNTDPDKSGETLVVNQEGLLIDGQLVCSWARDKAGSVRGPLGYVIDEEIVGPRKSPAQPCPVDAPIRAAADFNYASSEVDPRNEILIHLRAIDEDSRVVDVPYRGKVYRGVIPEEYQTKLNPGKGTRIERLAAERRDRLRRAREKELQALGVSKTRSGLLECITKKRGSACFEKFLPVGDQSFEYSSIGGLAKRCVVESDEKDIDLKKLSPRHVRDCLRVDEEFRSDFISCLRGTGSSFEVSADRTEKKLSLVPDDAREYHWSCDFLFKNGRWLFKGMSWFGC